MLLRGGAFRLAHTRVGRAFPGDGTQHSTVQPPRGTVTRTPTPLAAYFPRLAAGLRNRDRVTDAQRRAVGWSAIVDGQGGTTHAPGPGPVVHDG